MAEDLDKVGSRRFMSKLSETITGIPDEPSAEVRAFAPPSVRLAAAQNVTGTTRLQTIGQFVTALTYREAMAMGVGIASKMQGEVNAEVLTRAMQDWAWEWETFMEEERPTSS
jgi:hypothetical protein